MLNEEPALEVEESVEETAETSEKAAEEENIGA